LKAAAFAAHKHRDQQRKDKSESPYINHPTALAATIAKILAEVTDDKRRPKERRKELQVGDAAHISKSAKLVKLADKISNLTDILASPPAGWSLQRKREYFDGAKRVIDQVRGTNTNLERRFDALDRKRPFIRSGEDSLTP
jgi:guanosine-3',5'-bis(diphosphate) 3'-pyrophosphohydrolase